MQLHDRLKALIKMIAPIALLLLSSVVFSAQTQVKLAPPDWNITLKALQFSAAAPKLVNEEFALVNKLRPLFNEGKFTQAMAIMNEEWPQTPSAALLFVRAQTAVQLKQYARAERDYLASIESNGDYLQASQALAQLAFLRGDEAKARKYLVQAIELGGKSANLYGQLGYLNLKLFNAFSAVSAYQQAYSLEPQRLEWQQGLLLALNRSGAYRQALALVDALLQSRSDDSDLWLHKANAAMGLDDSASALAAMEVALRLGERNTQNVQLASQLNLAQGNINRAVQLVTDNPALLNHFSRIEHLLSWLANNDRWRLLQQLLSQALKRQADYSADQRSQLYTQYARLDTHRGRGEAVKKHLNKALDFNPSNGDALLLMADQMEQDGQLDRADMLLTRAEALPQWQESALLRRARIAWQRQQYRTAHDLLHRVMQLNPARRDLLANMETLQRIIRQHEGV